MRIRGKDWIDWLHQIRAEAKERRKSQGQSLAEYLRLVEGKAHPKREEIRPSRKRRKSGSAARATEKAAQQSSGFKAPYHGETHD